MTTILTMKQLVRVNARYGEVRSFKRKDEAVEALRAVLLNRGVGIEDALGFGERGASPSNPPQSAEGPHARSTREAPSEQIGAALKSKTGISHAEAVAILGKPFVYHSIYREARRLGRDLKTWKGEDGLTRYKVGKPKAA